MVCLILIMLINCIILPYYAQIEASESNYPEVCHGSKFTAFYYFDILDTAYSEFLQCFKSAVKDIVYRSPPSVTTIDSVETVNLPPKYDSSIMDHSTLHDLLVDKRGFVPSGQAISEQISGQAILYGSDQQSFGQSHQGLSQQISVEVPMYDSDSGTYGQSHQDFSQQISDQVPMYGTVQQNFGQSHQDLSQQISDQVPMYGSEPRYFGQSHQDFSQQMSGQVPMYGKVQQSFGQSHQGLSQQIADQMPMYGKVHQSFGQSDQGLSQQISDQVPMYGTLQQSFGKPHQDLNQKISYQMPMYDTVLQNYGQTHQSLSQQISGQMPMYGTVQQNFGKSHQDLNQKISGQVPMYGTVQQSFDKSHQSLSQQRVGQVPFYGSQQQSLSGLPMAVGQWRLRQIYDSDQQSSGSLPMYGPVQSTGQSLSARDKYQIPSYDYGPNLEGSSQRPKDRPDSEPLWYTSPPSSNEYTPIVSHQYPGTELNPRSLDVVRGHHTSYPSSDWNQRQLALAVDCPSVFSDDPRCKPPKINRSCSLDQTLLNYIRIANRTCYNDTSGQTRNWNNFYDLTDFSVNAYQNFVFKNGVPCINAIKNKIRQCEHNIVGLTDTQHEFHKLWKKTDLRIERRSCQEAKALKLCTLKVMRQENNYCTAEPGVAVYVGSLFDYLLQICEAKNITLRISDTRDGGNDEPDTAMLNMLAHGPMSGESALTSLTGKLTVAVLSLVVICMLYTVTRDCCAPWRRPGNRAQPQVAVENAC